MQLSNENDVVLSRQRARQIAALLGFELQDQIRIATAVSEISRNAFRYARKGTAEFLLEGDEAPQVFLIRVCDTGPGIPNLQEILNGGYQSKTGMGLGLIGSRRLMDEVDVETGAGQGTQVCLRKTLPRRIPAFGSAGLGRVAQALASKETGSPAEEVHAQNQELLIALDELRTRQEELKELNRELEDTNRGVVALYAELADKADHLRQADEMKSKFLSNMSHEFRTPLNSMLALSRLLLDRVDGELSPEQEKQIHFIQRSAESLTELVNDLLDLAKVESGKVVVTPSWFSVDNLFGALRGMLRPLLVSRSLNLVFEDSQHIPELYTDEGKLSQIMRNLISNALKFTEKGEVRIWAEFIEDPETVEFSVADTGIGIAPEHQEVVFQEFTQIDSAFQRKVKGTGLGLPLSRKLTELLGGAIALESQLGVGSTFRVAVPRLFKNVEESLSQTGEPNARRSPVLVVEEDEEDSESYHTSLHESPYYAIGVGSIEKARSALKRYKPVAIVLAVPEDRDDYWDFLSELKAEGGTPVLVAGSLADRARALALGADSHGVKPFEAKWLLEQLEKLTNRQAPKTVLLIDDEDIDRYLVRQCLNGAPWNVIEAVSGETGLEAAVDQQPDLIFLDLGLPGLTGHQVLDSLKEDIRTAAIPVVVVTSQVLKREQLDHLNKKAMSVVSKADLGSREASEKVQAILAASGFNSDGREDRR